MPHIVIEYSAPLAADHDMQALCRHLFDCARATGTFADPAAIRVRALPFQDFALVPGHDSSAHVTLRILAGRDTATKASLTAAILAALIEKLPGVDSLTVDIKDIDPDTYAKRALPAP